MVLTTFFCQECISQRAVWTSLEKQLDPWGPIAFRGVSVPEFIRKPIATCDFPGGGGGDPLSHTSRSAHMRKLNMKPFGLVVYIFGQ